MLTNLVRNLSISKTNIIIDTFEKMSENPLELLSNSLKKLQTLRAQITYFSELLNKGPSDQDESFDVDGNVKQNDTQTLFVSDVKECLNEVNQIFMDFEKSISSIQTASLPTNPGPMSLLAVDPLLDRTSIPLQTIQTYKWFSKMREEATLMMNSLGSSTTKRSSLNSVMSVKKPKKINAGLQLSPQQMEATVAQMGRHFADLTMSVSKIKGPQLNPYVLEIVVSHTMKVILLMRGLAIENISLKAFSETFKAADSGKFNFTSTSKFDVFVKINQHAKCAMVYYQSSTPNLDYCLKQMLLWLQSYRTLFTSPCTKCNKILHDFLPPTMRDFRTCEPVHVFCSQI